MGLIKKDGYEVKGVLIKPAYAKVIGFNTQPKHQDDIGSDYLYATLGISNSRENLEIYDNALDTVNFRMPYDRHTDDIFNQIYTETKKEYLTDWEDDIVESDQ